MLQKYKKKIQQDAKTVDQFARIAANLLPVFDTIAFSGFRCRVSCFSAGTFFR